MANMQVSREDFTRVQEEVKKNNAGLMVDLDGNKRAMKQNLNSKEDFLCTCFLNL